ncbi:MAG: hypothetical protein R3B09_22755 [Nannocystaceae bacterium]
MPRTIELDDAPDPIAAEELPKDFWSAQLQIGDDHYHARRVAPGYYTINDDQGRFVVGSTPSRPVLIYCDGGNDWIIDASGLLTWDEVSARLRAMCEAESLPEEIELQDLTLDYAGVFSGEFLAEWGTVQPMRGGYRFFPEDDVDLEAIAAHRIYRAIRVLHAYGPWAAFLAHTPAPELEVLRLQCCELPGSTGSSPDIDASSASRSSAPSGRSRRSAATPSASSRSSAR